VSGRLPPIDLRVVIRRGIARTGLSLREFARAARVDVSTVSRTLSGVRQVPDTATLAKILTALARLEAGTR
jgi:transcriptional regulator with XRE-family HTH domain